MALAQGALSAYLHCHGDCKWFGGGPVYGLGRASLCSLALIAAGSCERIMAGGGNGADGGQRFRGWRGPFLLGSGVACSVAGRGRRGAARLTWARGRCAAPGDMMIDWVSSRLRGDAAAQSIQAVRLALRGRTGSG